MVCKCTPEQLRAATRTAVLAAVLGTVTTAARTASTYSLYQGQRVRPAAWYTTTVWQQGAPRVECTSAIDSVSMNGTTIVVDITLTIYPV